MNRVLMPFCVTVLMSFFLLPQECLHAFQQSRRPGREALVKSLPMSPDLHQCLPTAMKESGFELHFNSDRKGEWLPALPLSNAAQGEISRQADGVREAWVRRYGSGNAASAEVAVDVAVDAAGNVYIAGYAENTPYGSDFLTAKYGADGQLLWTAMYNGGANDYDWAAAVGLDASGNVYVSGTSHGPGIHNTDFVTIKYSPDGTQQWQSHYDGPSALSYGGDWLSAMVVDSAGNVYVTGGSPSGGTSTGFATIKYNSDGVEQWVAAHHTTTEFANVWDLDIDAFGNVYITGAVDGQDYHGRDYLTIKYDDNGVEQWQTRHFTQNVHSTATAISVDQHGSVYVTGTNFGGDDSDITTVKYGNNGQQIWAASYDGPANARDEAFDLAVDDLGNVYVTGTSAGGDSREDILTIKYNTDGLQLWAARHAGSAGRDDAGYRIQLDGSGDVSVAGWLVNDGESQPDYAILKYRPDGFLKWVRTFDGDGDADRAYGLAIDESGNTYLTGYTRNANTGFGCATLKYNSLGIQQWSSIYNREGNSNDEPVDMTYDDAGHLYVLASSVVAGRGTDYLLIKYNQSGEEEWITTHNGPDDGDDRPVALTVDAFGNVYVTGDKFWSDNIVTIKYDPEGNEVWRATVGDAEVLESSKAIAVDGAGNVYVTGIQIHDDTELRHSNYMTVKYDSDGEVVWIARDDNEAEPVDLAVDADGSVYVTGTSDDSDSPSQANRNFLTVKYDASGNHKWAVRSPHDFAQAIALDALKNVHVLGTDYSNETGNDFIVVKYGNNGVEKWVARYGEDSWGRPVDFAVDLSGNVVVTGGRSQSGGYVEFATARFDNNGNRLWVQRYGVPGVHLWPNSLALDGFGNAYVTGETYGASANSDFMTLKYSTSGELEWQARHNSPEDAADEPSKIIVDAWGNVYVTGTTGRAMVTTIKYTQSDVGQTLRTFNLSQNYPNPFNAGTTIRYRLENASRVTLKVYNLLGQEADQLIDARQASGVYEVRWNPANAPSGTYVYRLEANPLLSTARRFAEVKKLVLLK